ncbi:MAG: protein-tyrosine phosphatase family protein [Motilibacteraceae bacterium]
MDEDDEPTAASGGQPGRDVLTVDPPTEVLPGRLWISGSPVPPEFVAEHGITAVVDVADPDSPTDPDELERAGVRLYRKEPLVDDAERLPDLDLVEELVDVLVDAVGEGHRALVCCSFGRNRSGLVAALTVRALLAVPGAEALRLLRARRRRAVNNPAFAAHVTALPAP